MSAVECSVCLEPMDFGYQPMSVLRCGHSFHSVCINSWFECPKKISTEANKLCPECRLPASKNEIVKLFAQADVENVHPTGENQKENPGLYSATRQSLEAQVANLSGLLEGMQSLISTLKEEKAALERSVKDLEDKLKSSEGVDAVKEADGTIDLVSPTTSPCKN